MDKLLFRRILVAGLTALANIFLVYLFLSYEEIGGNGGARRVMEEVRKLPMRLGIQ